MANRLRAKSQRDFGDFVYKTLRRTHGLTRFGGVKGKTFSLTTRKKIRKLSRELWGGGVTGRPPQSLVQRIPPLRQAEDIKNLGEELGDYRERLEPYQGPLDFWKADRSHQNPDWTIHELFGDQDISKYWPHLDRKTDEIEVPEQKPGYVIDQGYHREIWTTKDLDEKIEATYEEMFNKSPEGKTDVDDGMEKIIDVIETVDQVSQETKQAQRTSNYVARKRRKDICQHVRDRPHGKTTGNPVAKLKNIRAYYYCKSHGQKV